jgi:hypothetical protein
VNLEKSISSGVVNEFIATLDEEIRILRSYVPSTHEKRFDLLMELERRFDSVWIKIANRPMVKYEEIEPDLTKITTLIGEHRAW